MSYQPTEADLTRLYGLIGFKIDSEYDFISIEEGGKKSQLYLKVFSDHGLKDNVVGQALQDYLTARGVPFKANRPRSLTMQAADFEKWFGPNFIQPMFQPNAFEANFKRLIEVFDGLGIDVTPVEDVDNYQRLLDMSNPEVSQFFHDWKAYLETKKRFTTALAKQVAKYAA